MTCQIDAVDVDFGSFSEKKIITARIEHVCCECGETIRKGQKYEHVRGFWDGSWATFKTCIPCRSIRDEYFCSWVYGGLSEAMSDVLDGMNYITGKFYYED